MSAVGDSGEGAPLLGEIVCLSLEEEESTAAPAAVSKHTDSDSDPKQRRLVSLDVFRGLTIALMILVDDAGKAFPSINHSPWFGVTLADFVMPFFLFIVGVSASLVFKRVSSKPQATKKVLLRTVKLFILGVFLQGGYFHGRGNLSYGVDIAKIRWMGVLQRISIGYLFSSILEIWFTNDYPVDSSKAFVRRYYFQAMAGIFIGLSYLILLYGLYVPDWFFEISSLNMESSVSGYGLRTQTVNCGVRGSLEPPCNVVGLIDRLLLGEKHLYQRPVYRRTKECSVNSPDYGPLPSNAPGWCLAPFDPEGILSSLMAAITCLVGLHFGHILVHVKDHMQRVIFWSIFSVFLTLAGYVLELAGVPLSKPLYTLSYMFVTAGVSGLLLVVLYYIVDVKCFQKAMILFQWMGMNALILYALAACDLFSGALQGFYWYSPENNLVDITERFIQAAFNSKKWGTLVFVMLEILFWGLVAGFLHAKKVYIKL
ncbi:heparan-alpha-glucosaminide N-acetyltransferase isoform X1 [Capsicum annuum]|uniref:heparan-alpha-glucosaminide N-acetyltransferase isoform X1 n=1 Tax=Capsicum annuum TaxID=4072 RepID=UPI001FB171DB|nr:heparan-alpha-glucosaminide N-acetyltransferase isoform X1 [Capsicum annuum]